MTDLTTAQAAKQLKISERTIRNWIKEKVISGYKLSPETKSVYRIPQSEVDRILKLRSGAKANSRKATT